MNEAKHTPGPWVIDEEMNLIHADDDRHTIICNFSATLKNPEVMADARLIAAAPDLLDALQRMIEARKPFCAIPGLPAEFRSALDRAFFSATAAIVKATGA